MRAGRLFREGLRNTGYETVSLFITVRLSLRRAALPLRTQPFKALLALLRFLPLPALRPSSTCTLALSRSFTRLPSTYLRVPQCLSWGGGGGASNRPRGLLPMSFHLDSSISSAMLLRSCLFYCYYYYYCRSSFHSPLDTRRARMCFRQRLAVPPAFVECTSGGDHDIPLSRMLLDHFYSYNLSTYLERIVLLQLYTRPCLSSLVHHFFVFVAFVSLYLPPISCLFLSRVQFRGRHLVSTLLLLLPLRLPHKCISLFFFVPPERSTRRCFIPVVPSIIAATISPPPPPLFFCRGNIAWKTSHGLKDSGLV